VHFDNPAISSYVETLGRRISSQASLGQKIKIKKPKNQTKQTIPPMVACQENSQDNKSWRHGLKWYSTGLAGAKP
jgi:hypothetical protein